MSRALLAASVCGVVLSASYAQAGTKAWKALEKKLPAKTIGVGALDVDGVRAKVKDFAKLFQTLTKVENDIEQLVGMIRAECAIDVATAIDDVAFAFNEADNGLFVLAFKGLDEKKVTGCGQKLFTKFEGKKLIVKPGKITAYDLGSPDDEIYAAWLAPDVVAISTDPNKKASLEAMFAGSAASGELAGYISKVSANQGWAALFPNENDLEGVLVTGNVAGADVKVSVRLTAPDAKAGAKMLADIKGELDREHKRAEKKGQAAVAKFFKAIKVAGKGADVSIEATAPTADLPTILPAL